MLTNNILHNSVPQVRWLIRRDMDKILSIENGSAHDPWTEVDFLKALRTKNIIGAVYEVNHIVYGFMLYELHKDRLRIIRMAVDPDYRHEAIGRFMVERLVSKLSNQRRRHIEASVCESNVESQLFFQKLRFCCVETIRQPYLDSTEDAYLMRYSIDDKYRIEDEGPSRFNR